MNRRSFLSALTLSAAAIAVDPEKLLWTPTKTIFIPPAPTIVCDKIFGVDMEFTNEELLLSADDFRERYLEPVMRRIIEDEDRRILEIYRDVYSLPTFRLTNS